IGADDDRLRKLLVLPDGKILAVGSVTVGLGDTDVGLVRYNPDGTLDATFGNGGIVGTPLRPRRDALLHAVLAPDGTVLVGGQICEPDCLGFLVRFLPDGRLDPSFAVNGVFPAGMQGGPVAPLADTHDR